MNALEQFLNSLRVGQVGMKPIGWRFGAGCGADQDGLLSQVAQTLGQLRGDAGTVIRQKNRAAGKDGDGFGQGRSIRHGDEHTLNTSPKRQRGSSPFAGASGW